MDLAIHMYGAQDDLAVQVEQQEFVRWTAAVTEPLKPACAAASEPGFVLGFRLTVDQPPQLEVEGALDPALAAATGARLAEGPRTRFGSAVLDVSCGWPLRPERADRLPADGLAEQVGWLRSHATHHLVPLLAAWQTGATEQFPGVRGTGAVLGELLVSDQFDADRVFAAKPFWRGVLEMVTGNPGVLLSPVFVDLAAGEIDRACSVLRLLPQGGPAFRYHVDELMAACQAVEASVGERLAPGIAHHDAARFDDALAVYAEVLSAHPYSAWALHERNLTRHVRDGTEDPTFLGQQHQAVEHDPLAFRLVVLKGREIDLLQRHAALMRGPPPTTAQQRVGVLRECADFLFDLGEPGYAGVLYHSAMLHGPEDARFSAILNDWLLAAARSGADVTDMLTDGRKRLAKAEKRAASRRGRSGRHPDDVRLGVPRVARFTG
jgi:hypothetical protein